MSSHTGFMFHNGLQAVQMIQVEREYDYPAAQFDRSSRLSIDAGRRHGRQQYTRAEPQLIRDVELSPQHDDMMGFEQSSSNEYRCRPVNARSKLARATEYSRPLRSDKPITDARAAQLVASCLKAQKHKLNARVLRSILNGHQSLNEYTLHRIVELADDVLFDAKFNGRVRWIWSSESPYQEHLLGTTTLIRERYPHKTMIVLSEPIIQSGQYGRNLLLSVLLHELVHCYLFLRCGSRARLEGGHTDGFHKIMQIINDWAGMPELHLCNMKADLDQFQRKDSEPVAYAESQPTNETLVYASRITKIDGAGGPEAPLPKVVYYCGDTYNGCYRDDCGASIPLMPHLNDGDSSGGESGAATPVEWDYKVTRRRGSGGKGDWVQSFKIR